MTIPRTHCDVNLEVVSTFSVSDLGEMAAQPGRHLVVDILDVGRLQGR